MEDVVEILRRLDDSYRALSHSNEKMIWYGGLTDDEKDFFLEELEDARSLVFVRDALLSLTRFMEVAVGVWESLFDSTVNSRDVRLTLPPFFVYQSPSSKCTFDANMAKVLPRTHKQGSVFASIDAFLSGERYLRMLYGFAYKHESLLESQKVLAQFSMLLDEIHFERTFVDAIRSQLSQSLDRAQYVYESVLQLEPIDESVHSGKKVAAFLQSLPMVASTSSSAPHLVPHTMNGMDLLQEWKMKVKELASLEDSFSPLVREVVLEVFQRELTAEMELYQFEQLGITNRNLLEHSVFRALNGMEGSEAGRVELDEVVGRTIRFFRSHLCIWLMQGGGLEEGMIFARKIGLKLTALLLRGELLQYSIIYTSQWMKAIAIRSLARSVYEHPTREGKEFTFRQWESFEEAALMKGIEEEISRLSVSASRERVDLTGEDTANQSGVDAVRSKLSASFVMEERITPILRFYRYLHHAVYTVAAKDGNAPQVKALPLEVKVSGIIAKSNPVRRQKEIVQLKKLFSVHDSRAAQLVTPRSQR
uniref:Uncharacterized protein n=1 Tax=Palpitomonas bilix TaxID=652834 RepID=A0A7S3GM37_9EUKA|mmetsp:Transcript_9433/g.25586  ORF Transcript_9433/g.25586 Transcript_9433/m.25586 type:complete len:535 (+) Transcript_9433:499-2103(+)